MSPATARAGRWHRRDNRLESPEPGYFTVKLCRGGPKLPCRIVHENCLWWAEVNGERHLAAADPEQSETVLRVWQHGERSDASEFDYLNALREWARASQPEHPLLHPLRSVAQSLTHLPPVIP